MPMFFFYKNCAKIVNPTTIGELKEEVAMTLTLFKQEFPPSFFDIIMHFCRNPTLMEVWGHRSHSRKWDLGVLRDSRKFRTQLQGSKHLALKCSLYRWKGLKVQMFKMASHEPFGHLQHKLWLKEGPRVKLAVWLPTTKNQESTWSRCVQVKCDTRLESS
jgi:hypothetical protein